MARDYKGRGRQTTSNKRGKRKPAATRRVDSKQTKKKSVKSSSDQSAWLRFVILLFIVLVLAAGVYAYFQLRHKLASTQQEQSVKVTRAIPVVVAKPVAQESSQPLSPVKFEFLPQESQPQSKPKFTLQLATLPAGQSLIDYEAKLTQAKLHYRKQRVVRLKQAYYRFQVGAYANRKDAIAKQQDLQALKIPSVVVEES